MKVDTLQSMRWSSMSMNAARHAKSKHDIDADTIKMRVARGVMDLIMVEHRRCPVDTILAFDGVMLGLTAAFAATMSAHGHEAMLDMLDSLFEAYKDISLADDKIDMEVAGHA